MKINYEDDPYFSTVLRQKFMNLSLMIEKRNIVKSQLSDRRIESLSTSINHKRELTTSAKVYLYTNLSNM